jgi:nitroreductase
MNETIKTILARRSVRKYQDRQITDEELNTILESAVYAPSAMNLQEWRFTAVLNKSIIDELDSQIKKGASQSPVEQIRELAKRSGSFFYNAPAVVIVSCEKNLSANPQPYDTGCAMQNMMIAAKSLGIGSCWIHAPHFAGNYEPFRDILTKLEIPLNHDVFASVALGYPEGDEPSAPPRKEGTVRIVR